MPLQGEAFNKYQQRSESNGINRKLAKKGFGDRLTRLGFGERKTSTTRLITGIKLKHLFNADFVARDS
jgi:hypothetical protein